MPLTVQVGAGPFSFRSACLLPHYLFSRSGNTKNTGAFLSAQPQFKILGCFYAMGRYRGHTVSSALLYTNSLGRAQILSLPLAKASSLVFGGYWGHVLNLRFWRHRCLNTFICTEARARKALSRTKTTFQTEVYNRPLEGLSPPPDKKAAEIP